MKLSDLLIHKELSYLFVLKWDDFIEFFNDETRKAVENKKPASFFADLDFTFKNRVKIGLQRKEIRLKSKQTLHPHQSS